MIYKSNLTCPDLTSNFKHLHARVMPHSFGHTVLSDWADKPLDDPMFGLYKNCGFWTHDEAAILAAVVGSTCMQSLWVDIGAHSGWTSKVVNWASNSLVMCVDPMLAVGEFRVRFQENTEFPGSWIHGKTSADFFHDVLANVEVDGVVIDGDHEPGKPLEDAVNAEAVLKETGVIIFHDALGRPVREGAEYLMDRGFKCRWYETPHGVLLCWRGDFTPPDHVSDPNLPDLKARCPDFDFSRCV